MGKRILKKLSLALLAVALISFAVPAVSAYEGHTVDIRARVVQPQEITKTARLASQDEINEAMGAPYYIHFPNQPNPPPVTDPFNIPEKTCVVWIMTITIGNFSGSNMQMVTVDDNFPAELAVVLWSVSQGTVNITHWQNQYRLQDWTIYNFAPGAMATLQLMVWTQCNPGGGCQNFSSGGISSVTPNCCPPPTCHQEYTTPGKYWLNQSGAVMKWYRWNKGGCGSGHDWYGSWQVQGSVSTGPVLPITVYAN